MVRCPAEVAERDPTGVYPAGVAGSGGLVFSRNRWEDAGGVPLSFHADTQSYSHVWEQPEALQLNRSA